MNKCRKSEINVIHILENFDREAGGLPAIIMQIITNSRPHINHIVINGTYKPKNKLEESFIIYIRPLFFFKKWAWSPKLRIKLRDIFQKLPHNSIIHIHGVWSAFNYFGAVEAKNCKLKFVLSSHGMLEPWLWNNQGFIKFIKKKIYWKMFALKVFKKADLIHSITRLEKKHQSNLLLSQKKIVIPHAHPRVKVEKEKNQIKKQILFLGRIEKKKGIHLLISAFLSSNLGRKWSLIIAGPVWDKSYFSDLLKLKKDNCNIKFVGPVFGSQKNKLLSESWVMCTPSYSEAIGLVNFEAAMLKLPTITTFETGIENWAQSGGLQISPNVEQITSSIQIATKWSYKTRLDKGEKAKDFILNNYSISKIASLWSDFYAIAMKIN